MELLGLPVQKEIKVSQCGKAFGQTQSPTAMETKFCGTLKHGNSFVPCRDHAVKANLATKTIGNLYKV